MMTDWQRALLKTYADGSLEHLFDECTTEHRLMAKVTLINDKVFQALMFELSAKDNCNSAEEAIERLGIILEDVSRVILAIRNKGGGDATE